MSDEASTPPPNRRNKILPAVFAALVILLALAGTVYSLTSTSSAPSSPPPPISAEASPLAAASASPGPSPGASPSISPSAGPLDLTAGADGLSRSTVSIQTSKGLIKLKLYSNDAPITVHRFVELVQKGFYDGLTFHRAEPDFVIQGGDPQGNGRGGSGTKLKAEFNARHHIEGTLAMARTSDPNSADSQFYIALKPLPQLDGNYTVFGQVVEGLDVIHKIQAGDKMLSLRVE